MGRHAWGQPQSGGRCGQRRDGPRAQCELLRVYDFGVFDPREQIPRTICRISVQALGHCAQSQPVSIGLGACEIDRLAAWHVAGLQGPSAAQWR